MKYLLSFFSIATTLFFAAVFFSIATPATALSDGTAASRHVAALKEIISFDNPIKSKDAMGLITSIISQLRPLAIMLIVLAIIYAGFRYVAAAASSNPGQLNIWRQRLIYILIGAAIVAGAPTIIGAAIKFVQGI